MFCSYFCKCTLCHIKTSFVWWQFVSLPDQGDASYPCGWVLTNLFTLKTPLTWPSYLSYPYFQNKCAVIRIWLLFLRTGDSSVPTSTPQKGGGKTDAQEVRACYNVSSVESPALFIWGLHEPRQVSLDSLTTDECVTDHLMFFFLTELVRLCKRETCWAW